jgi:hypothetical protein
LTTGNRNNKRQICDKWILLQEFRQMEISISVVLFSKYRNMFCILSLKHFPILSLLYLGLNKLTYPGMEVLDFSTKYIYPTTIPRIQHIVLSLQSIMSVKWKIISSVHLPKLNKQVSHSFVSVLFLYERRNGIDDNRIVPTIIPLHRYIRLGKKKFLAIKSHRSQAW